LRPETSRFIPSDRAEINHTNVRLLLMDSTPAISQIGPEVSAMEMYQVRYFLSVARALNFTRAAEDCGVARPT